MTQPNCVRYVILLFTAQDPTNRLKGECHDHLVETQCNLKKSHHIKYADLERLLDPKQYTKINLFLYSGNNNVG